MADYKIPKSSVATPEFDYYATMLFQLPVKVQFCHHSTTSYAAHKALDKTYNNINDLKDSILEKLIGCMGYRYKNLNMSQLSNYSEDMNKQVAEEICQFAKKLMTWADSNGYSDIGNLAQEYLGTGNQLRYLLTLS